MPWAASMTYKAHKWPLETCTSWNDTFIAKKIVLHKAHLHAYAYKEITEKCTQPAVQSHFLTAVIVWVVPIEQPSRLTIDPVLSLSSHRSHTWFFRWQIRRWCYKRSQQWIICWPLYWTVWATITWHGWTGWGCLVWHCRHGGHGGKVAKWRGENKLQQTGVWNVHHTR
jgi:hypothetical protein